MTETKNIRLRHAKTNPAHFIDFQSNEKDNDRHPINRNNTQFIFMYFTAGCYLFHTLRAYIPTTNSHFWSNLAIRPITRVYTTDLRPSIITENLLFRLAENWQTFWLIYILSYIQRRNLSRYLNIFNTYVCFLLITALALQTVSQSSFSPEVSCACLCLSMILLMLSGRIIAIKSYLLIHKSTNMTIDLIILRYFILNSLFLYTTCIVYSTMCAIIECIGIYLDPNVLIPEIISICTTIGLSIILIFIFIYFLCDQYIYTKEFFPIWTPYLFIAYAFICPPLRQLNDIIPNNFNFYLLWTLFCFNLLIMFIRFYRQISMICSKTNKKKLRISSFIEQIVTGIE